MYGRCEMEEEKVIVEDYEFIFVDSQEIVNPVNELLELLQEKEKKEEEEKQKELKENEAKIKLDKEEEVKEFNSFIEKHSLEPEEFNSLEQIYYDNIHVQTENIKTYVEQQEILLEKIDEIILQNEESMNLDSTGFFFIAVTIAATVAIRSLYDHLTKW